MSILSDKDLKTDYHAGRAYSSVGSGEALNRRSLVQSPEGLIFFLSINDIALTVVYCFDILYVGKQSVAWKEYCVEYWLTGLQESMALCTGCRAITKILLKNGISHRKNQSIS